MPMTVPYGRGDRSAREMRKIIDELVESIQSDAALAQKIIDIGVNPEALTPASITVDQEIFGPDLLITVDTWAILDVWRLIFLPRIRRRWGAGTIGQETDESLSR